MHLVVFLKIIVGIGNEATEVATEKKVGHDVSCIIGGIICRAVAHTDGDMLCLCRSLEIQCNGGERLVVILDSANRDGLHIVVVVVDKEQAVSQGLSFIINDQQVAYASGDVRGVNPYFSTTVQFLEMLQNTTAKYGQSVFMSIIHSFERDMCSYGIVLHFQMKGTAIL